MRESDTRSSLSSASSHATPHASRAGSVSETAATASQSPTGFPEMKARGPSEDFDNSFEINLKEKMEEEKSRYPGASSWAPDEERLFEILYLRQDLPMLPPTWDYDLRGVPISEAIFKTSEQFPPIVYAHTKDFLATFTLLRLIDLTAKVRASLQTGFRQKVPGIIKQEMDRYLRWAAQDGEYANLRIVPNIVTEVIDTTIPEDEITEYIQSRMRALGRLQQEFLREDKNPEFWDVVKPSIMISPRVKVEAEDEPPDFRKWPDATPKKSNTESNPDEWSVETPTQEHDERAEIGSKKRRLFLSHASDGFDEAASFQLNEDSAKPSPSKKIKLAQEPTSNLTFLSPHSLNPGTPQGSSYRRHPPVVYGLFILNTSVLLLTIDSSQQDDAYVSFHVQVDFSDRHQSVWNALTIAIAVCRARDELMTRISDFEALPIVEDSDPDA